ncbi:MAG: hypothetical protein JW821_11540, partial [Deltaproteobacteria bacterium]|nr:hypothetical protein [Deltaproteobacteria bacterium]
ETHVAYEERQEGNEQFKMLLTETDGTATKAQVTYLDWGYGQDISLTAKHDFQYFTVKYNQDHGTSYDIDNPPPECSYRDESGHAFLQWGWWEDLSPTDPGLVGKEGGNDFYAATSKIWYIEGDMTHPDYIDYLQQQGANYIYSGEAKGVYGRYSPALAQELSGPFSCSVNFASRQLSNVSIQASGGSVDVNLTGGSGTVQGDGTFDIESFSGNITVGGTAYSLDTNHSAGGGAFFGATAQGIAGVWNANSADANHWASGEFHGKR